MPFVKRPRTRPKVILFDLDGTLLRVQMGEYIIRYVHGLAACCAEHVKPARFETSMVRAIRDLIGVEGDGGATNEQRIITRLQRELSVSETVLRECFDCFRANGLHDLAELVKPVPLARTIVADCLALGIPLVLATNPVFPAFMVQARLRWGDLSDLDFVHQTSLENSRFCKPHAGYFREIASFVDVAPEECLMIGNDTEHDLAAAAIGMETFLVDTWVIEREAAIWPCRYRGDHAVLRGFLRECLT
jgi:FMN phosphatase YigB (HAD superfamily)